MTEAWATKTKGILVETVNMQKNEAAQEAKGALIFSNCAFLPLFFRKKFIFKTRKVKNDEKLLNEEIRSVKEALKLEQENRKSGMFTAKADTSGKKSK